MRSTRIFSMFCLAFLFSCASTSTLTPKQCLAIGKKWGTPDRSLKNFVEIEKKIVHWMPGFINPRVEIQEFLTEKNIKCSDIDELSLKISRRWTDQLSSIPLIRSQYHMKISFLQTLPSDEGPKNEP